MSYGRVAWQTPLGGEGLRLGVAMSEMQYSLGKDFQVLNASGSAQVNTLWLSLPMLRSTSQNHYAQFSYDRKRLEDRVELTATQGEKTLDVLSSGISGHLQDSWLRGGQTNYSANFIAGRLGLQDQPNAGIYATSGIYQKLTFALSRLQQLGDSTSLYASLSGQMAGKNLDSSEKFSLGGAYGIRAFPQGELSADDAWLTSVELRWSMNHLPNLQLLGFFESGTARINHTPLSSDGSNTRTLSGEGLGLRWGKRGDLAVQGYVAWRSSGQTSSTTETDRSPRFWLQAAKYF
jgi:hemolysin activation/secretion protein